MVLVRPCPVCDHDSTRALFRPNASPGQVVKCVNCGMVYISRIEDSHALIFDGPVGQPEPKILTSSDITEVSDSWEFKLLPNKQLEQTALRLDAIDTLHRIGYHLENPYNRRTILDFGSGWGFFLSFAKEHGWTTFGLEPLPASAVYARATFGLNIKTDTLRDNSYPPDFFDVITSFQVFEHLPFPKKDIQHLYNMLKQNGLLLIEVPNIKTWSVRMMKSRHRHFVQDHINFFSIDTLSQVLVDNGFKIIDQYHPKRRMSVRYLTKIWFKRYLPAFIGEALQNSLQSTSLWQKNIGLTIGDIISVIGRKVK